MNQDNPIYVFILGNGFSQGFGFPGFKQLWDDCLRVSSKTSDIKGDFEALLDRYPLSYFCENNIKDIELLLSVWSAYISIYEKIIFDHNNKISGRAHYETYLVNLCGHLLEYGDEASVSANYFEFSKWIFDKLQHFEFCFITFNYDLLLEKIINEIKKKVIYLKDPKEENEIIVRKLHGSVNWLWANTPSLQRKVNGWKPPIIWSDKGKSIYIYNINDDYSNIPYIAFRSPPVLIPPILNKEYTGIFQELLTLATKDLRKAKFVIMVGYSLPNADLLIRRFLLNCFKSASPKWAQWVYVNSSQKHCEEAKKLFGEDSRLEIINDS